MARAEQSRGWSVLRKLGLATLLLVVASLAGCGLVERAVDRVLNSVRDSDVSTAEPDDGFADSLFVVDLHADSLLFNRGVEGASWFGEPLGHVDSERLVRGNVAVQVLSTVSQFSFPRARTVGGEQVTCVDEGDLNLIGLLTWLQDPFGTTGALTDLRARIEAQGQRLADYQTDSDRIATIRSAQDFEAFATAWRDRNAREVGAILAIEGLHFYPSQRSSLDRLWEHGFRMAALTHHFDNGLGGSSTGCEKTALTPAGQEALDKMAAMGWTLDLAHASGRTIDGALDRWDASARSTPPLVSHSGLQGMCEGPGLEPEERGRCKRLDARNLSEQEAHAVARRGGVIGVIYWGRLHGLTRDATAEETVAGIVRTFARLDESLSRYTVGGDLCTAGQTCLEGPAARYLAFGSDWDGAISSPFDASGLSALIAALRSARCGEGEARCLARGHPDGRRFSDDDVRAMAGWNACRVLLQSLPGGKTERDATGFCESLRRPA